MSVNINNVKNMLNDAYELFDNLEQLGAKPSDWEDLTLRQSFETDLMTMLMYFSASDGKLSSREALLINELFDYHLSPENYISLINKHDIYSTRFEDKIWLSLEVLKKVDDVMKQNNKTVAMPVIFDVIENIAKLIICVDDNVDNQEVEDFNIFFTNLKNKYMPPEELLLNRSKNATERSADNSLKEYYLKKKR